MKYIKYILSWSLALVFILSTIGKLLDSQQFMLFIDTAFGVKNPFTEIILYAILSIEILLSYLLVFKVEGKYTYFITLIILVIFSIIISYALITDLQSACGCLGSFFPENGISLNHLLRNILMILISFGLYRITTKPVI